MMMLDGTEEGVGVTAKFTMGSTRMEATLVDMPCVIETQKTPDRIHFYKTGDISQVSHGQQVVIISPVVSRRCWWCIILKTQPLISTSIVV